LALAQRRRGGRTDEFELDAVDDLNGPLVERESGRRVAIVGRSVAPMV
jgi:hypothetical protein